MTLVRLGLWPASPIEPTTAFTFELLDWWAACQLEGHMATKTFSSVVKLKNSHLKRSIVSAYITHIYINTYIFYMFF